MGSNPSDDGGDSPFGGINIVPLVDVVLVLLVIFMVTAPMMMKQTMDLTLPKARTSDARSAETLGLVITKAGQVLVNGKASSLEGLESEIKLAVGANPEIQAVISADLDITHGLVVQVIDAVRQAGVVKFALEVERKK